MVRTRKRETKPSKIPRQGYSNEGHIVKRFLPLNQSPSEGFHLETLQRSACLMLSQLKTQLKETVREELIAALGKKDLPKAWSPMPMLFSSSVTTFEMSESR